MLTSITMPKLPAAKKRLGQNWLINPGVLDRMVRELALQRGDTVVEVGPGTGALTERLARTGARIIAVEKDRERVIELQERFDATKNVEIVSGDILHFEPEQHGLHSGKYSLVGNIPYYLTSRLIRIVLEQWRPKVAVCMVQYEVAQRMMTQPPDMNLLALAVQLFARPTLVMRVSRGSFRPIPEVDSAVVRLDRKDEALEGDRQRALELARKAFGHKRKQLTASLPLQTLAEAGIEPTARPQELGLVDWLRLSTIRS